MLYIQDNVLFNFWLFLFYFILLLFFLRKIKAAESDYVVFLACRDVFFGKLRASLFCRFNVIFFLEVICLLSWGVINLYSWRGGFPTFNQTNSHLSWVWLTSLFVYWGHYYAKPFSLSVSDLKTFYLLFI